VTLGTKGAHIARGTGCGADRGADVEHGLVEFPGASGREEAVGQQLGLPYGHAGSGDTARQYADHIGVDRSNVELEGERLNGPGRIGAYTGECA